MQDVMQEHNALAFASQWCKWEMKAPEKFFTVFKEQVLQ